MKYLYYLTIVLSFSFIAFAQEDIEYIDSDSCVDCHEESKHNTAFEEAITNSVHEDLECLDCHTNKETVPHQEELEFDDACEGCRSCHDGVSDQYQAHGRSVIGSCEDMPHCFDCHGSHDVLPSEMKNSKTHPVNLPNTCGKCHENLNITQKYDILIDHPIEIYEGSVHGKASMGGIYVAATCNDCHSSNGSAHKILSPGEEESSINHFKIPNTCGQCHKGIENDFWEGIHGQLVARGETDAPVCTDCHGEHGIISPDDPKSPVSSSRVAKETCSPCHDSAVLNEKYGLPAGKLTSFIDSYHGLKSKAGDSRVANCSSCHGVHRILPSSDSTSSIYPSNLQYTCGECHPGISEELAASPIHGITGQGLRTPVAGIVEDIYIAVIVFTIGFMLIHWFLDLTKQIRKFMKKPQVRRMRPHEVWQHTCLMLSFIALVITGFALRFSESWIGKIFYAMGSFEFRGTIHRIAAVIYIITIIWHIIFLLTTRRGKEFFSDMMPKWIDLKQFGHRMLYYIGKRPNQPEFGRFGYVEKIEYWALIWGTIVMIVTGLLLWFDNYFIHFLPKGALDIALVVHYWEAWLATLAILIWHLYSTVYSPDVYPMNTSWITGTMSEEQYAHEHPAHLEEAKKETERYIQKEMEDMVTYHTREEMLKKIVEEKTEEDS